MNKIRRHAPAKINNPVSDTKDSKEEESPDKELKSMIIRMIIVLEQVVYAYILTI
jgi:hypothetical protein